MDPLKKNRTKAVIYALIAGPLGLMYVSPLAGLLMLVGIVLSFATIVGPIVIWVLCVAMADHFAHKHNQKVDALKAMMQKS